MTSIRKLASALCLATFCSYSSAQTVDTTGNLINNNNWSGVIYGYDPHDCCSNPGGSQPLYNIPDDIIQYSYGQATVSQSIGIQNALSAAGTGLQVIGYNWSWWIRNDNGGNRNQNGVDTLNYWVNTTSSTGQLLDQMSGTYNTSFGPTTFSGTRTYASPYNLSDLGNLTVSFSGRDGGFWAGLYGPEVANVNISFNYSIDPCASDPLYSPSCSGYTQALLASLPVITEPVTVIETAPVAEIVQESVAPVAAPTEPTVSEFSPVASAASSPTTIESSGGSSRPGVSTSQILSILANEQSRLSSVERGAVESSVSQATREAESATSQAEAIASSSSTTSVETSIAIANQQATSAAQSSNESLGTGIVVAIAQPLLNANAVSSSTSQSQMVFDSINVTETTNESSSSLTSVTSIENLTKENSITTEQNQEQTQQSTVNRNAPNNEAAGAVTLASYTQTPAGFDLYFNSLTDSPFYAPKEIYKNQKNVDNARILRQLSGASDKVHAEMVEQQYGR